MPTITTTDGVALHVTTNRSLNDRHRPTVVLIAGYTAPATTWMLQEDALVEAGYSVVCIDRRSHGRSDAPHHGQRIARHAKDIDDVLTHLDLSSTVLVGASMGASAMWSYSDLFGTSRVRGLVSVDQTPRMLNGDGWDLGYYGFDRSNAGTFFTEGIPPTGKGSGFEQTIATLQRIAARLGPDEELMSGIRPETLPLLQDHAMQDWRDVIARVDVPVLMVAGRESQLWPAEHAVVAAESATQGRASLIEECGHAVNLDQPETFNTVLLDFLKEIET